MTENDTKSPLINDLAAAPPPPAKPEEKPPAKPEEKPLPTSASRDQAGGDRSDGFLHTKLSPEGTQTGPERQKRGTTRGPNITIPLKRLGLTWDSKTPEILDAVAKYAGMAREEMDGVIVFRGQSKMNCFELHRPRPGESELRPGTFEGLELLED